MSAQDERIKCRVCGRTLLDPGVLCLIRQQRNPRKGYCCQDHDTTGVLEHGVHRGIRIVYKTTGPRWWEKEKNIKASKVNLVKPLGSEE